MSFWPPHPTWSRLTLFATNALALGISQRKRIPTAFSAHKSLSDLSAAGIRFSRTAAQSEYGVDLSDLRVETDQIILPQSERRANVLKSRWTRNNFELDDL